MLSESAAESAFDVALLAATRNAAALLIMTVRYPACGEHASRGQVSWSLMRSPARNAR
jgi:hypothetical protein